MARRVELKKTPLKPLQAIEPKVVKKPTTAPQPPSEIKPQARMSTAQPKHAPALPGIKPPSPAQIKNTTAHSLQRQKRSYSVLSTQSAPGKVYDIVKSKKSNMRKKTDLTHYADAVYAGGVFHHAPPGQSM